MGAVPERRTVRGDVAWISDEQRARENCPKLIHFARELNIFESKVNVFE